MPSKPPRPCRAPGCGAKTAEPNGYCESHAHMATGWNQRRRGRSGRGGRPWRRKRESVLQRDRYLCQHCLRAGRATPATEVDHITALAEGGRDDESNLEAICSACHQVKTQAESQRHREGAGQISGS
ncbi:HNH endonuclease [Kushneria phosphatilytica]|uniref:Putative HNH nuclease YajD n=1 Tax=Kushneria phosphatilytica TaxID=657387 RepID=A0A1S1P2J9_9GAMM|nr:HNH endonuclease signature motif containing protein [Kushneria phosphatilytica]OHV13000.1 HNH endonuclease [Kushneria phosphatilytica]QEL10870.1 HNH endonuclease [Kushneria phosphatilytica]